MTEIAFWLVLALLVYLHGGYALLLAVLSVLRPARPRDLPSGMRTRST